MWENEELPVEAIVAHRMDDPDWEELIPPGSTGCSRCKTMEKERSGYEAEPNIDKFTSDALHSVRTLHFY